MITDIQQSDQTNDITLNSNNDEHALKKRNREEDNPTGKSL